MNNIILFDGQCNLCNNAVRFILKRGPKRKFRFASLPSEIGRQYLDRWGISSHSLDTMILIKSDVAYTKSSATLHIAKELNGFWKLLYVFIMPPKSVRDYFYMLLARNR
ncbi:MAG TPA: DUF393 domain-containing protein [Sphingobacterium sp.]|nr:DUF393 domain-containing protein [Sphingobacterium sp.]